MASGSSCSITPSITLKPGSYTWSIRASNDAGYGPLSDGKIFTVNSPPNTPSIPKGSNSGYAWVPYTFSTSTKDPDGDQVKYTFDWGDKTSFTTGLAVSGSIVSALHSWSKPGPFQVKVMAIDSNGATSAWSGALTVKIAANNPPNAPAVPVGTTPGIVGTPYSYFTKADDTDNDQVKYTFDWGDNTPQTTTSLVASGATASMDHSWSAAGTYPVKAMTTDSKGATSGWSNTLSVTISGANHAPNAPDTPSGQSSGMVGTSYRYSTSAKDLDNDQVKYTFDWGDNTPQTTTSLVASGATASMDHSWSAAGTYPVKAMTTDSKGATSGWSNTLSVTISGANHAPNAPDTPSGQSSGMVGTSYRYSTSAKDLDNDQVKYTFDWGDNTPQTTTSLVASGATASMDHSWSAAGTYPVKAMTTDSKGATSGWSNTLSVTITANCNADNPPTTASPPSGQTSGSSGTSYSYSTVANDGDTGDQLQYTFDWADGTTNTTPFVNPGIAVNAAHSWSVPSGTSTIFYIRAKAIDKCGKSNNPDWSNPLAVTITGPGAMTSVPFTIVSANSGNGIPKAYICVVDGAGNSLGCKYTDGAGQATFTGISGTWQYTVTATGYVTNTGTFQVAAPPSSTSMRVYMQIPSLSSVQAIVAQVTTTNLTKPQNETTMQAKLQNEQDKTVQLHKGKSLPTKTQKAAKGKAAKRR